VESRTQTTTPIKAFQEVRAEDSKPSARMANRSGADSSAEGRPLSFSRSVDPGRKGDDPGRMGGDPGRKGGNPGRNRPDPGQGDPQVEIGCQNRVFAGRTPEGREGQSPSLSGGTAATPRQHRGNTEATPRQHRGNTAATYNVGTATCGKVQHSPPLREVQSPLRVVQNPSDDALALCFPSLDTKDISDEVEATCGEWKSIVCLNCGHLIPIYEGCGDRHFCRHCRKRYLKRVHGRFGPVIEQMTGRLRLLTLTVVSGPDLKERLDHLLNSYKRLKQRAIWKGGRGKPAPFRGGVRALEITYNPGSGWHPHLHILFEGAFVAQADLAEAWEEITGDSCMVDIRQWKGSVAAASRELIKYCVKDSTVPEDQRDDVRNILRNRRLFVTFGSLYRQEGAGKETHDCPICGKNDWFPEWLLEYGLHDPRPFNQRGPPVQSVALWMASGGVERDRLRKR